jgi:hypothetical protein
MDTPSSEPSALNVNTGAEAFASFLEPSAEPVEKTAEAVEAEVVDELRQDLDNAEPEALEAEPVDAGDDTITIRVDGKDVVLSKAELADNYKNGLRQADYTKKTMATAEALKSAEAETVKAQQDRQNYANNLQRMAAQLEGGLQQQQNIDWNALLEADPVEFMRQQHLQTQRQAAYRENMGQQQQLRAQYDAEQATSQRSFLSAQQDELLAKLPDWKDPTKATEGKAALKSYLINQGFNEQNIDNIQDHKAVLLGRKAMLYDQMMDKARAASKKVQTLPNRVVRPGVTGNASTDGRSSAMQKLNKTGKVEDAAAAFASFI